MTYRHEKARRILGKMIVFTLFFLGLAIAALLLWTQGSGASALEHRGGPFRSPSAAATAVPASGVAFPDFSVPLPVSEIADTQYLKLVNRDLAIATPVNHARLVTVWPDVPARDKYVTVHETVFEAVRALFLAAQGANIHTLFVACGFRYEATQRSLYENALDRSYVMPPGHSEHQLGLAVDILTSNNDFASIVGSPEAAWLAENAPRFGLILRYPVDKQHITEVPYEPWHFRYVGRVHAWYMGQNNFVLEEYIAYLQTNSGYQVTLDGRDYYVLYQQPRNGVIFVPEDMNFNISSTNIGGYIVTAWR